MKIAVFPNLEKSNAYNCTINSCEILNSCGAELFLEQSFSEKFPQLLYMNYGGVDEIVSKCDVILVVGGDGTILHCAKIAADYDKPILGINSGRLGFMATLEADNLEPLRTLFTGEFHTVNRMMLDVKLEREDGSVLRYDALNDVAISRSNDCKITDFEVKISNQIVSLLRADGVIFSTPTGSTAYSLSAGGPIIDPEMECIEFTQICPFSLFARTMIFSPDKTLQVTVKSSKTSVSMLSVDGQESIPFQNTDKLYIAKSQKYIKFVDITGCSFYQSVNSKLMQPLKGISEEVNE